jgi:hypothetical protein
MASCAVPIFPFSNNADPWSHIVFANSKILLSFFLWPKWNTRRLDDDPLLVVGNSGASVSLEALIWEDCRLFCGLTFSTSDGTAESDEEGDDDDVRGGERRHWPLFCTGTMVVRHAVSLRVLLQETNPATKWPQS